ncbi:uncharacterized protein LOC131676064 [Topomyia yanbarensis]|uniref:uncharacterized protein LOC131676064 n=1 Tax=Topomyia yanbarensis TaxID=2498891 RepID=UPI00273A9CF5|nr:uncharacterized protein LOC131676064 [Topomyia yanbarensis]
MNKLKPPQSDVRSLRSSTTRSSLRKASKVTEITPRHSKGSPSTTSSTRAARLEAQMKLVEEEQLLKEQELKAQEAMRKKELEEEERRLQEKKLLLEEEAKLRERKLQDEKEFQKQQQLIRKESLEKKSSIIRQLSECGSRGESIPDSEQQIEMWLQQCSPEPLEDKCQKSMMVSGEAAPLLRSNAPLPTEKQRQNVFCQGILTRNPIQNAPMINQSEQNPIAEAVQTESGNSPNYEIQHLGGAYQAPKQMQNLGRTYPASKQKQHFREPTVPGVESDWHRNIYGQHQQIPNAQQQFYDGVPQSDLPRGRLGQPDQFHAEPVVHKALGANQMAARQIMGKELPPFSGNPEDWPIFICSFEQSTAACGYTDTENLIRLQRCLKGHALESVRSRLLLPTSVPHVINTLRTLYGRPELLIRTLIEKVQRAPAPRHDRLETVMEFGLTVQNLVDHLKTANQFMHLSNPVLMQDLADKLPGSLKMEWAVYKSKHPCATLATFGDFMAGLVYAASQVSFELPSSGRNIKSEQRRSKEKGMVHIHSSGPTVSPIAPIPPPIVKKQGKPCATCEREGHRVADCRQFKSFSIDERWKFVNQKGLCRTCLNSHGKWPCKSWQGCGIESCRQKHHTLLHSDSTVPSVNVSASHLTQVNNLFPMFRILPVVLYGRSRKEVVFAFVDEGSSITLLEETLADRLGLSGPVEPLTLQWTGKISRDERQSRRVELDISGEGSPNRHSMCEVRTVSCLVLPPQTLKYDELSKIYPHLRGLPLNDHDLAQPKLLIGLDNLRLTVPLKVREGGPTDPIAAKCRLGWSIYGCTAGSSKRKAVINFHVAAATDPSLQLNNQLRDYFTLEDAGVVGPSEGLKSNEDLRAREIMEQTTRRTERGFETGLVWRDDEPNFPDSYAMAVRRLHSLERKLTKNPYLQKRVWELIDEYLRKGYAHKATEEELKHADPKRTWFLPLGVVVHPKKPNKVRLVWDAAATVSGVSFNSKMLTGPDLLTPLPAVLSRFRQFPIAVCGDIQEMFHQLWIRKQDRLAQCFLWRNSPANPIDVFVMDVATFGATCSPASAQYVKNVNAQEFAEVYPRAVTAIVENHYVDDYLDSFETVNEAAEVVKDVIHVHSMGGFGIRHFRSNSPKLLQEIGENTPDEPKDLMLERGGTSESVLGMTWNPADDCFSYSFNLRDDLRQILNELHVPTKREVLKVVMSLFDPLGLVSHFLIHAKVIIQSTWTSGIGWDDPIDAELYQKWCKWVELFPKLNELKIPRCYFSTSPSKNYELQAHTFVDASDVAYSCAVYFRIVLNNSIKMVLVGAKSKVAPIKTLSTPRLELKAAILGLRFVTTLLENHTLAVSERFFWSDSTRVLAWIRSDHRRFPKFVSVRIGEILTSSEPHEWRWVPSKYNVSDDATKWKAGPNLNADSTWLNGPQFLRLSEDLWPEQPLTTTSAEEIRLVLVHSHSHPPVDYSRFSKWSRLHRAMAYVIRFTDSVRRRNIGKQLQLELLTQDELARAEILLWKMAQTDYFSKEKTILEKSMGPVEANHSTVPKTSCIYKTWPYMDEHGVVRMRGRIGAAHYLPFETRYPVILPKQHPVTTLIVDWYHHQFRHANRETVTNEMRQRFEVAKLRSLVQRVAKNCTRCRVFKATPKSPVMAPLPEERLEPYVRPFTYVGLDYFGPVYVKVGRSQAKRWIALFTCLSIRAVHMEIVHNLTTESCVMAVRRFVSRRGSPAVFYSDNGTCFQGANRQLQEEITRRNEALATTFTNAQTKWKFIPPAAPHMGGAWERLVRSVKSAIGSSLDHPRKPNDETLETIIYEAEALVNARPLTYIPLEYEEQESLTPNHFLLGSSTGNKIEPAEVLKHATLRSSWKMAQYIVGEFWKRWVREYLPVITRRSKWFEETKELAKGDLVLVVNGTKQNQWTRGRIVETVVGRDGRIRQALVRTASGIIRRPATRLAVLNVDEGCKPTNSQEDPELHQGLRVGVCADNTP